MTGHRIGIDTGGTFTDFTVIGPGGGFIVKVPSTPDDPSRAVLQGLDRILEHLAGGRAKGRGRSQGTATPSTSGRLGKAMAKWTPKAPGGRHLPASVSIVHGTTVGTNALITRRVARTAFVTTLGFEDLVEIGRQNRDSLYDLAADRPEPLVPRSLRFGVKERIFLAGPRTGGREIDAPPEGSSHGMSATPPTRAELTRLRRRLHALDVESIAIGFLHSYLDPAHEEGAAAVLGLLGVPLTLSHRISGEYREYERFSTAIANAALQPVVGRYLRDLAAGVAPASVSILQSDGTTATAAGAAEEPVRTVLSGPAGGALAAFRLARRLRDRRLLSFDMGGTSTDAVLIDHDLPCVPMGRIGGLPLRSPTLDVKTVGAGGGSIARRDAAGALRVGPGSAGADPGPACYGKGDAPTVTDAHLVLGRLGEQDLLGGEFPVDGSRSKTAVSRLARSLGLSLERTAEGILTVVEATMERALRTISTEQGKDPRAYALYAFGGAGGLHACALAERLGIRRIVVPPGPGAFSATGLAGASAGVEEAGTCLASSKETGRLRAYFARLERAARDRLHEQGLGSGRVGLVRLADLRYEGQSHEITVAYGPSMVAAFHRAHRKRFGHAREGSEVEVVTLRVRARVLEGFARIPFAAPFALPSERPGLPPSRDSGRGSRGGRRPGGGGDGELERVPSSQSDVKVTFGGVRLSCAVVRRDSIRRNSVVRGPARVTEYSATTFVAPGWTGRPGPLGTLVLTAERKPERKQG